MFYTIICILQGMAIAALFIEALFTLTRKPSQLQSDAFLLTISTMIMMVGYLVDITGETEGVAYIGTAIAYIGKPFCMTASFFFVMTYFGYNVATWLRTVLLAYSSIFPVLVFTNRYHHLYYATVSFVNDEASLGRLSMTHGPFYYLYMISIFAYLIMEIYIALSQYKRCKTRTEKNQVLLLFVMLVSTMVGYMAYLSGITNGYDSTMAGATVGVFALSLLFAKYKIFDVVSMAKEHALNDASSGILVLDQRNRVAYANTIVERLTTVGYTIEGILQMPDESILKYENRVYSLKKNILREKEAVIGSVVEINDITDSYSYANRLEKDVEERTEEILHIQRSVIGGIANIVEARNGETGSHIIRTGEIVSHIANQLHVMGKYPEIINEEYIRRLVDAAPLHDIGKITIPDNILMKPGKLTTEEFDIMKGHSAAGVDIIEKIMRGVESEAYVTCAEDVAHYHHEKWDGSGYPEGLSGEKIPLSARIMAVADVYDALRSERCYKKAMDKETARNIIAEGSGKHFDPVVVTAFFSCINQIEPT